MRLLQRSAAAQCLMVAALAVGMAACFRAGPYRGTLVVTASPCVGPHELHAHYVVADVRVVSGNHTVAHRIDLTAPYRFRVVVAPGDYLVSASADGSRKVHVFNDDLVRVMLTNDCI